MAVFWRSYVDMVFLMLWFIRATREADWNLHFQCVKAILPWAFAYDRVKYARYLSAYWYERTCLESMHADEQSINRDTKTSGGIVGMSQWPSATQRWILTMLEGSFGQNSVANA